MFLPGIHQKLEGASYWKELTEHGSAKHRTSGLADGHDTFRLHGAGVSFMVTQRA